MVQKTHNQKPASQRSNRTQSPRNVIIVYEQPKVIVVRHYTKTIVPEVNPAEYRKQYDRVLLDTSTLLALTRRLNIQENLVRINIHSLFSFSFGLFQIDHTSTSSINQTKKKNSVWLTSRSNCEENEHSYVHIFRSYSRI
jgi:hypothetical protein